jgi:hypothetical protein
MAFFQVTGHGAAELNDISSQIEQTLQKQKVDAAMEDIKKKTTIWMDDQYFAVPVTPPAGAGPSEPPKKNPEKP